MAKPIKLRDFLLRLKESDPAVEVLYHQGKSSLLKTLPVKLKTSSSNLA